jgi:hypothetical protein
LLPNHYNLLADVTEVPYKGRYQNDMNFYQIIESSYQIVLDAKSHEQIPNTDSVVLEIPKKVLDQGTRPFVIVLPNEFK